MPPPPYRTLDPTNDIVFKMLFADERNRRSLISLLTAVLRPEPGIEQVTVKNPEIERESVVQRGAVLDVAVTFGDGRQVDVEMQASKERWFRERVLYYWARLYSAQLQRGDSFEALQPTIGVCVLGYREFEWERYESVFEVFERTAHERLTDRLRLHFLELSKLPPRRAAAGAEPVLKWGWFLAARSDEERAIIALEDPEMSEAKDALERLSADPEAQELAWRRDFARWNTEQLNRHDREINREKVLAEGRAEGRAEALREAIACLCDVLGVPVDDERRAKLEAMGVIELEQALKALRDRRAWPD